MSCAFAIAGARFRGANGSPASRSVGDLRVEQLYDEDLLRHLRLARLVDIARSAGPDALPALYDPVLVAMSPQAFTLMGFERIEGVEYAQSWLIALP